MDKNYELGIITAQCLTEPLTQASLSSFHSVDDDLSQDVSIDFNNILGGGFKEIKIKVDTKTFDPFESFVINFYEFSKLITRRVEPEDQQWGLCTQSVGLDNLYEDRTKILTLVLSKKCIFSSEFLCYYLQHYVSGKDLEDKFMINKDNNIDIVCEDKNSISSFVFIEKDSSNKLIPLVFDVSKFCADDECTIVIKDCAIDKLLNVKGIISYNFQTYEKILKYDGIEQLRYFIKEKLVPIVGDTKYCNILADYLTHTGTFKSDNIHQPLSWLSNNIF